MIKGAEQSARVELVDARNGAAEDRIYKFVIRYRNELLYSFQLRENQSLQNPIGKIRTMLQEPDLMFRYSLFVLDLPMKPLFVGALDSKTDPDQVKQRGPWFYDEGTKSIVNVIDAIHFDKSVTIAVRVKLFGFLFFVKVAKSSNLNELYSLFHQFSPAFAKQSPSTTEMGNNFKIITRENFQKTFQQLQVLQYDQLELLRDDLSRVYIRHIPHVQSIPSRPIQSQYSTPSDLKMNDFSSLKRSRADDGFYSLIKSKTEDGLTIVKKPKLANVEPVPGKEKESVEQKEKKKSKSKRRPACTNCRGRHISCDREDPCGTCIKRGVDCISLDASVSSDDVRSSTPIVPSSADSDTVKVSQSVEPNSKFQSNGTHPVSSSEKFVPTITAQGSLETLSGDKTGKSVLSTIDHLEKLRKVSAKIQPDFPSESRRELKKKSRDEMRKNDPVQMSSKISAYSNLLDMKNAKDGCNEVVKDGEMPAKDESTQKKSNNVDHSLKSATDQEVFEPETLNSTSEAHSKSFSSMDTIEIKPFTAKSIVTNSTESSSNASNEAKQPNSLDEENKLTQILSFESSIGKRQDLEKECSKKARSEVIGTSLAPVSNSDSSKSTFNTVSINSNDITSSMSSSREDYLQSSGNLKDDPLVATQSLPPTAQEVKGSVGILENDTQVEERRYDVPLEQLKSSKQKIRSTLDQQKSSRMESDDGIVYIVISSDDDEEGEEERKKTRY